MHKHLLCLFGVASLLSCTSGKKNISTYEACSKGLLTSTLPAQQQLGLLQESLRSETALFTLENGGESFVTRLWLIESAKRSLDIQYYSFSNDRTGLLFYDFMLRAANRGVRIRILVDDAASRVSGDKIKLLDSHHNIEVKAYNAGLKLGRIDRRLVMLSKNRNRVLRRMHNKAMVIDDETAIMGGRNIADEYFDLDKKYNFRDRDLLLLGRESVNVKNSFEQFWTDTLSIPLSQLSKKSGKFARDPQRFDRIHKCACDSLYFPSWMKNRIIHFPDTFKKAIREKRVLQTSLINYVSDVPGKNEDRPERKGGICTDSLINIIRNAQEEIIIDSPYLITTPGDRELFADCIRRGVKIRVLTNSLLSTDNHEAFSGFQKDRQKILDLGIELYEFKPDPAVRYHLTLPEAQAPMNYAPVFGMHSKSLVADKRVAVISSYNFDPRSQNLNTECLTIIRTREMGAHLLQYMLPEFAEENAWHVTREFNPDKKAPVLKKWKVLWRKIIPKKWL